ncbi:MAG TPA: peptide-methionine (R)-S-oxide reductase MsrB [Microbacteriaceae bacterium]
MEYPVSKTNEQWREALDEIEFQVLRLGGTERPFTGELLDEHREGVFTCRGCGEELFDSNTKFDSRSGWPSFYEPKNTEKVELIEDRSHGMLRTEVRCAKCGGHLGHVFDDAPQTPTGERFCINSVSLKFKSS